MSGQPLISICIPAYKRTVDLGKLLDSIGQQTFRNFEVIITDDSPDDDVKIYLEGYRASFTLRYFKNPLALGTPENWNEGIRMATGSWMKLMHDDDYFSNNESLAGFVAAIAQHPQAQLFYSAFAFVDSERQTSEVMKCNWFDRFFINLSPYHLLRRNYFGNPSCTLVKKDVPFFYDKRFKYIVDFAYYIKLLMHRTRCVYVKEVLIHVGLNEGQVTHYTFKNKQVQVYENHTFLEEMGTGALKNLVAYDYFWRLYRNFSIRSVEEIREHYEGPLPKVLVDMIAFQKRLPAGWLNFGLMSKIAMLLSYCRSYLFG